MHQRHFARVGPRRAKAAFYIFAAIALYLTWRLYDVQVLRGPVLAKEALAQRSDTIDVYARRGSILDREGNVLVRSLPSESVYAVPHDLTDPSDAIARLGKIFGALDPQLVAMLRDKNLQYVWVARKISYDQVRAVRALKIPGINLVRERTGRSVDTVGTMASTVLGFVGIDDNGLDGIEYAYDGLLRGQTGKMTIETDEFGRPIPFGHRQVLVPAKAGLSLELTIDSYLQYVAETALAAQVKQYRARSGTAIVMDPNTGAVLALANVPDYDPNRFWRFPARDRSDRAVLDAYEPGSTYKLVTAAAAIESGRVTPTMRFESAGPIVVGGRTIHDAVDGLTPSPNGNTLETIVADSLNVGAAEVAIHIGGRAFYRMERRAGFGSPTRIGLPGENPGIVPPPSQWSGSSLATMAFGQGIAVTPLALTRYYCAIANGGLLLRPRLLHAILGQHGQVLYTYPTEVVRRVFSPKIARQLRQFLRAVVVRGTGDPSAQIPGYTTAGKTGTAQIAENGAYLPGAYVASFIGMIPYHHPRFVILVKVDRPEGSIYGSEVAAPAFVRIAKAAMIHAGILPDLATVRRAHGSRLVNAPSGAKP
ncbi:MAG: peptidoglycan D,D-transpeptidase FtsI family protein [Vulcanimicrobiaceae bacterium]